MADERMPSTQAFEDSGARLGEAADAERYRLLAQHLRQVIFHLDERGCFTFLGPSWELLTTAPVEEWQGRALLEAVHPEDRERLREHLRALPHGGPPLSQEVRLKVQGEPVWVELSAWSSPAGPGEVVGTLADVSERRQLEARLLMTDRLVTMGMLTAGTAHDLNNPLSYVLANLDFLRDELQASHEAVTAQQLAEWREVLGEVREGAERVRQIVRDFKAYTRVEESDGPVELHRVLDSVAAMAASTVRSRARLVKEYGARQRVHGNEGRLSQVFLNLVVNAAQAIAEGREEENEIRLSTRDDEPGWVVAEVRDTGVGIAAKDLERIFEPFFTTKRVGEGTGLGLAISQGIIRSLGGDISVESTVGGGTTFRIALPVARAGAAAVDRVTEPEPPPRQSRVLVIDDEPAVAQALGRLLEGHVVEVAHGGRQGLQFLASRPTYDVVLCDLVMPEVTGMDVYEEVVARMPALGERFLFVTGGGSTRRAQEFIAREAHRVLDKPFDRHQVRQRVAQVLAGLSRSGSPS